ncbi:MAG: signal peptide peptidase SppA [Saprospiraceae bacterium]
MSQFFKFVFASCLGVFLATIALFAVGFLIMAGIAGASGKEQVNLSFNTILQIKLDSPIPEQTNNLEMNPFDFAHQEVLGLNDIVASLVHAKDDPKIEGILLDLGESVNSGFATAATLRTALEDFKESGKFITAYAKNYSQGTYYLASVADKVYVSPLGGIDFHGLAATIPFFKELLDKVGVKMQVFYAGQFKSATEPYRRNDMSDQNRQQLREFLDPLYDNYLTSIGESRNKSVDQLKEMANNLTLSNADEALRLGMVDQLGYIDNVLADLRERLDLGEKAKIKTISLEDYANTFTKKTNFKIKDKIAVVYAEGAIYADQGDRGTIVDNDYIKIIRKLREDDKVKAIVLRVNSPGGSAIASENIWREFKLAKEAGKPIVVSMGDYAASGGYYIACMADKIFAEPNTLTGSIGVFSMIPNMAELYNDKLGIHFDTVLTAKYSVGLNTVFDMDDFEKNHWQANTDKMYEIFLSRVGEGRKMERDAVHEVAQGRVWIGPKAKEIGLVDEIGDIDDALAAAAELASLDEYRVSSYPTQPDPMQEFINEITGQNDDDAIRSQILQKELGVHYEMYQHLKEMINTKGVQARLPFMLNFN